MQSINAVSLSWRNEKIEALDYVYIIVFLYNEQGIGSTTTSIRGEERYLLP
jgi:hypothetical protein